MRAINAGGNEYSRPQSNPTIFIATLPAKLILNQPFVQRQKTKAKQRRDNPLLHDLQFTACDDDLGSIVPARVSATTCCTTARKSPVCSNTRSCRSALVPSFKIECT